MAVARILGIDDKKSLKSLNDFPAHGGGLNTKGKRKNGIIVYDDYGHHPTEIKAMLKGAREFFWRQKDLVRFPASSIQPDKTAFK